MELIPYGKQNIQEEDIESVADVLRSDFLTQGPKGKEFEEAFAQYVGSRYAVSVANGTAALHLSAIALDIKPGDKVITTPMTFAATANCVRYCGGDVIFCDIDPDTQLLDIESVRRTLEDNPDDNIVGIIPVDFTGLPVNLEEYRQLADEYGLWLLEDACHAPGGYFIDSRGQKQYCGNGNFAELAIFSFHPVKHIAAGEGGMITTNDPDLYERITTLRTHGITKEPNKLHANHGGWYYEMQELGYNYRLTDMQSALGLSQLKRADEGLHRRNEIAATYDKHLPEVAGLTLPPKEENKYHAYHLYVIQSEQRKDLFDHLRENHVLVQVHYIPVHYLPYYRSLGWQEGDLPNAEDFYRKCLSIPMFPSLSEEQQMKVIELIKNYVGQ